FEVPAARGLQAEVRPRGGVAAVGEFGEGRRLEAAPRVDVGAERWRDLVKQSTDRRDCVVALAAAVVLVERAGEGKVVRDAELDPARAHTRERDPLFRE